MYTLIFVYIYKLTSYLTLYIHTYIHVCLYIYAYLYVRALRGRGRGGHYIPYWLEPLGHSPSKRSKHVKVLSLEAEATTPESGAPMICRPLPKGDWQELFGDR